MMRDSQKLKVFAMLALLQVILIIWHVVIIGLLDSDSGGNSRHPAAATPLVNQKFASDAWVVSFDFESDTDDAPSPTYLYRDASGKVMLRVMCEQAQPFSEGRAAVSAKDGMWYFINERGQQVSNKFSFVYDFSDGYAVVNIGDGNWAYINRNGDRVDSRKYKYAGTFEQGQAMVCIAAGFPEVKHAVIDRNMEYVIEPAYGYLSSLGSGYWLAFNVLDCNRRMTYILDSAGVCVFRGEYDDVSRYMPEAGLFVVRISDCYTIVNKHGDVVLPGCFSDVYLPWNGLILARDAEGWKVHKDYGCPLEIKLSDTDLTYAFESRESRQRINGTSWKEIVALYNDTELASILAAYGFDEELLSPRSTTTTER
jgi:hypothetical protein